MLEIIFALFCVLVVVVYFSSGNNNSGSAALSASRTPTNRTFFPILDQYKSLPEAQKALRDAGLESSQLIIGIDYTKSNTWQGKRSFGGKCLHAIEKGIQNPYQEVISVIGRTLEPFDDDGQIPAFGFGDMQTSDRSVFKLGNVDECDGFGDVLDKYEQQTPSITLSGPTSFAPVIHKAIEIVRETKEYHILLIIADGQVSNERETVNAIVEASNYALSIVLVGVGDGPWDKMEEFDDALPARRFDNFQFVDYHKVKREVKTEAAFALSALMEIPDQYKAIRQLHLLGKGTDHVDVVD